MNIDLTELSSNEYNHLLSGRLTPTMAAQYLRDERIVLRTFAETLRSFYPAPDLCSRLTAIFQEDADPGSAARKVRNWLSGQNRPSDREDVFRICFGLLLTEAQTSCLLGLCTDYGIHYRDGRDVVYAWFLRHSLDYGQAKDFFVSLPPVPHLNELPEDLTSHLTQEIRSAFLRVQDTRELRACYLDNLTHFGTLHLRAYNYFQRYLDQLIHPADAWGGLREPDYSVEAVMDLYLSLSMPSGRDRTGYNLVQKLIKRSWPNATALKNIRSRKMDVPRKLLLLLYVITENVVDDSYTELDEEYLTLQDRLEDHWWSLNAILTDCGMPLMDPRNATDWLVLYAVTATDEPMSERMEQVIEHMFSDED